MTISVLIVGAGPTGLTLACELARRGVGFRIVDAAPRPPVGSRGKGLQPRSLEVLDDLGVVDEIVASGTFHLPFRAYDGATVLGVADMHEGRFPTPNVPYASPLIIPQWRVEEILRHRIEALGGAVELGTELTDFRQDADGVTATLARGGATEEVRADYLVGCDGGRSDVRRELGVRFDGETREAERMLIGDFRVDGLDRDHWHVWPKAPGGALLLCPLPGTDAFQLQAIVTGEGELELSLAAFQKVVDERSGRTDLRLREPTWLSLYRANVRMVDRYRVGRVFLAGDAAHVHSPAGGQGMNTGIQDAYNLGWKLGQVAVGAPSALLDTYEEERLPIAAWMLGVTTRLHRDLYQPTAAGARGPETLQLDLHYRASSLSRDRRTDGADVRAGDRAPDAPCRDTAGGAVRLFDLFRGPHFTLLAFGAGRDGELADLAARHRGALRVHHVVRAADDGGRSAIVDAGGHAHAGYGVDDAALVLVRPDGHIGAFAGRGDVGEVAAYLERYSPPTARGEIACASIMSR